MERWPAELIRFIERPVPMYAHLAAGKPGVTPFVCRGYGAQSDQENGEMWIYILQSQWRRLNECMQDKYWLAALLTAGTDNESYQLKGRFAGYRSIARQDRSVLERQRKLTADHFPHLLRLVDVDPSLCLAVGLEVNEIYLQTPGPHAGILLSEGGR